MFKTGKFKNGMQMLFVWFAIFFCVDCGRRVGPFSFCYDMPGWYRRARGMGPFHNHVHCVDCHKKSELEHGHCETCKNKI